ncbi:MAG: Asp-tRNA(Asn)/Glu-tRNA(Gln) amidotransferase subunit GatB [Kiritimatiellia bacterium]|jgi:aspartyl-tRNA(Asn)/glutamyl-tRNA(Gln) amidotransferase subunit B
MKYIVSIGLETHVQLKTASKMFCGCATSFAAEPNTNVCPVCLGYPGALPQLNREAVKLTVLSGLMLGCKISGHCKFDRKNYFYPDAAKNYQISQLDQPLCLGGAVEIQTSAGAKTIRLTRIHLEEDVAKSTHHPQCSGVDFNRSGLPLMEIVSEPDMASPEEAVAYLRTLRQILVYTGVSDCNLEEGNMRCDVNVSLRPEGADKLGTKVELKNMNSFSHIQDALRYEIARQERAVSCGEAIVQETRRWDLEAGETASMRTKEDAQDYRYFPEPDLMPIALPAGQIEEWSKLLPELPAQKRTRFVEEYQLPEYDAKVLCQQLAVANFFEQAVSFGAPAKAASNWIMTDLLRLLGQTGMDATEMPLTAEAFAALLKLVADKTINMPVAKALFDELFEKGGDPVERVKSRGLGQVSDAGAIDGFARQVVADNPKVVDDFKGGKKQALQYLVGQVMKLSRGKANPTMAAEAIEKAIAQG